MVTQIYIWGSQYFLQETWNKISLPIFCNTLNSGTNTQGSQEFNHADSLIWFRYRRIVCAYPKNHLLSFTKWPAHQNLASKHLFLSQHLETPLVECLQQGAYT